MLVTTLRRSLHLSEGRGSLHSFLKARGWATSVAAGVSDEGMSRSSIAYIFVMSIHLTDSGLEKVFICLPCIENLHIA